LIDMNRWVLDPSARQLFLEFSSSASRATLLRIFRSAIYPSQQHLQSILEAKECLSLCSHSSDKSLELSPPTLLCPSIWYSVCVPRIIVFVTHFICFCNVYSIVEVPVRTSRLRTGRASDERSASALTLLKGVCRADKR
jgi:hypothetical protein